MAERQKMSCRTAGIIIAIILFPVGIIFFGVSAVNRNLMYAGVVFTTLSLLLVLVCYYYEKLSREGKLNDCNGCCVSCFCCRLCITAPDVDYTGRRNSARNSSIRRLEASLRHEGIFAESLRRNAPLREIYAELNSIVAGYEESSRLYPDDRHIGSAVRSYVPLIKDDIKIVKEWALGEIRYTSYDIYRMTERARAWRRTLEGLRSSESNGPRRQTGRQGRPPDPLAPSTARIERVQPLPHAPTPPPYEHLASQGVFTISGSPSYDSIDTSAPPGTPLPLVVNDNIIYRPVGENSTTPPLGEAPPSYEEAASSAL